MQTNKIQPAESAAKAGAGPEKESDSKRPFGKLNYMMMGGCLVLIVLGFLLMSGGGSPDNSFNPDIFSTRRIVVGPLLAFLGFLLMAFAIVWSPDRGFSRKK